MKQLILVRHAKSSWRDASLDDHERPLNARGLRNAPDMGARLARRGFAPQLVVASTARRALDTAELLARALDYPVARIEPMAELYACEPRDWLRCIHALPADADRVLMIGHNPEITAVCNMLAPLRLDNVPTCGMLWLEYEGDDWRAIGHQDAARYDFDYPKRGADPD
jgi:phosphohistidine phosphatase